MRKHNTHIFVERLALCRRLNVTSTDYKVTKALAIIALRGIALDHGFHDLEDLILLDTAAVQLVQALTVVTTT